MNLKTSELKSQRPNELSRGQLLLEILLSIAIAATVLGIGGGLVYVGLKGNKASIEKDVALGIADEAFEAVRAVAFEKWQNLDSSVVTRNSNYYPAKDSDSGDVSYKWVSRGGGSVDVRALSAASITNVWYVSTAGLVERWTGEEWVDY